MNGAGMNQRIANEPPLGSNVSRNTDPESLNKSIGSARAGTPMGTVMDKVGGQLKSNEERRRLYAESIDKMIENREKWTGAMGFFFGAKLPPNVESIFQTIDKHGPMAVNVVLNAVFPPLLIANIAAAGAGTVAEFTQAWIRKRKDELKKSYDALDLDPDKIMDRTNDFPEERFTREVMTDLLPMYLFDLGKTEYKDSNVSRPEIYNAGRFTENFAQFTTMDKEQKAYVKIRAYALRKIIENIGIDTTGRTSGKLADRLPFVGGPTGRPMNDDELNAYLSKAVDQALNNQRAGAPRLSVGNPELTALLGVPLTNGRMLTGEDVIGRYFNSASDHAESAVKSALQKDVQLQNESPEIVNRVATEKIEEVARLLSHPVTAAQARSAVAQLLSFYATPNPQDEITRFVAIPPLDPTKAIMQELMGKFNNSAAKLQEYLFQRPNEFIDLKARELNLMAKMPYAEFPAELPLYRDALMRLFSLSNQDQTDALLNRLPVAPGSIEELARKLVVEILGLDYVQITFAEHIKLFMDIVEGKESYHYLQAVAFLQNQVKMTEGEIKRLLGSDSKAFKDKLDKEDPHVLAYLQMLALVPKMIDLNAETITITGIDISGYAIKNRGGRAGVAPTPPTPRSVPPYRQPASIVNNRGIYDILVKNMQQINQYNKLNTNADKNNYMTKSASSPTDFEVALLALFNQEDSEIARQAKFSKGKLQYNNPGTFTELNPNYSGPTSPKEIDVPVVMNDAVRSKMGNGNYLDVNRVEIYSLLGLPPFASSRDIANAAESLNAIVATGEQLVNIERGVLKPGVSDLSELLDEMFNKTFVNTRYAVSIAISSKFFEWLFKISNKEVAEIDSLNFTGDWIPGRFGNLLRAFSAACQAKGRTLASIREGAYTINGVTIGAEHFELMALHNLNPAAFFKRMQYYNMNKRSIVAYTHNPDFLVVHNKNLAGVVMSEKGITLSDIESPSFGANTPVHILDIPKQFENAGDMSRVLDYVDFVDKRTKTLEDGFAANASNPHGSALEGALTAGIDAMMFANRGDIVPALTMLVQTQEPEVSQSVIYMLKLLRDTFPAATWADFVAFSNSGVNDERILNMMSVNTSDRAFNAQVLRNYRAGVNRLNGLYATNGFFRGMVDTPNYRSFEILSLLLATFNVIGRESKVEIPTFSNIIGDMGIATGSWGSAADTAAFLRAIYNLRNTGGRQLSHPEESPIVLARKAVNLFKKDGKLDPAEVGNVLSQRQVRIDEVRKSKNPTPEYDGNQLVNLVSLFVGDQGNTSIADGNKVEMFPKN